VNAALSDEARESQSVGALRDQLTEIESEVEAASSRLALTKARVAQNLRRVDELKGEAVRAPPPSARRAMASGRKEGRCQRLARAEETTDNWTGGSASGSHEDVSTAVVRFQAVRRNFVRPERSHS